MKAISSATHRALDYGTVLLFALAPTLFGFSGGAAHLSWGLAVVHAILTLLTHFPGNAGGFVPYRVHLLVELLVGCALIVVGVVVFPAVQAFYCGVGGLILLVVLISFARSTATPDA